MGRHRGRFETFEGGYARLRREFALQYEAQKPEVVFYRESIYVQHSVILTTSISRLSLLHNCKVSPIAIRCLAKLVFPTPRVRGGSLQQVTEMLQRTPGAGETKDLKEAECHYLRKILAEQRSQSTHVHMCTCTHIFLGKASQDL